MNDEPQPNRPEDFTAPVNDGERSKLEQQLSQLRPRALRIDDQSLDALLASRREIRSPAHALPLSPAITPSASRSWGTLAAAWSVGVAVGVLAMLAIQSAQQPRPTMQDNIATVAPDGPTSTVQTSPTVAAIETSSAPAAEAAPPPERRVETAERSLMDNTLWQASLFADDLRVGTHIYITTKLAPPSRNHSRALERRDAKWPKSAGDLGRRPTEPWSAPSIATPRSTIEELLGEGSNVFGS